MHRINCGLESLRPETRTIAGREVVVGEIIHVACPALQHSAIRSNPSCRNHRAQVAVVIVVVVVVNVCTPSRRHHGPASSSPAPSAIALPSSGSCPRNLNGIA